MASLKKLYKEDLAPKLQQELGLKNVMEIPRITKITLNMGVGEAIGDKKVLEHAVKDLEQISGQKVVVTKARKSIAGFKVREDWPVGCKVTLRQERMYEFLERLVAISIPRIRDFRGISLIEVIWKLIATIIDKRLKKGQARHGKRHHRGEAT